MTYQFYKKRFDRLRMIELQSLSQIAFTSKHKMDELYPNGGYEVIGEIGNFAKKSDSQDIIITDTGKSIHIFPRGSVNKPFEWIAGYAAVEENTYVAVVKSVIPQMIAMIRLLFNISMKIY